MRWRLTLGDGVAWKRSACWVKVDRCSFSDALPGGGDEDDAFGRVAASLRSAGRKVNAPALDALIAAVAVAHELPLYTVNPDDFDGIAGLDVVAIEHPDHQPGSNTRPSNV